MCAWCGMCTWDSDNGFRFLFLFFILFCFVLNNCLFLWSLSLAKNSKDKRLWKTQQPHKQSSLNTQSAGAPGKSWSLQVPTENVDTTEFCPQLSSESLLVTAGDWWQFLLLQDVLNICSWPALDGNLPWLYLTWTVTISAEGKMPMILDGHYPCWLFPDDPASLAYFTP